MQMPKPTDAHRKLEKLVGSWQGDEHFDPSPMDPVGGKANGRLTNRLALDGFVVIQDYEQERNGVINYRGHGVFRWDANEQCYLLYWFDSMGMPPSIFRGTFEDNVLTLTSKEAQGHTRAIWSFADDNHYHYRMEVSPDGGHWQTFVEGKYVRKD